MWREQWKRGEEEYKKGNRWACEEEEEEAICKI
jgi:hypothetical protein